MTRELIEYYLYDITPKVAMVVVFIVLLILLGEQVIKIKKKEKITEFKIAKPEDAHGIIFGKRGRKVVYSPSENEGSIGVFSASGTGKTSSIGVPTLRSWNGTSFTIDISGDICKNCPQMPNKLIFEPERDDTIPYNVFGGIDALESTDDKNEALAQLAILLMPSKPNMPDNAKFFLMNGRKILTASLIAFYHEGMDFIEICERIVGSSWKDLFHAIDQTRNQSAIMYINSFEGASEQNNAGCKQSCDECITLFATNKKVKKSVHRPKDDEIAIEPSMIENYNIFVIVDDPKIELFSPLLSILVNQQLQYISKREVDSNDSNVDITKKQILLMLDEFASLRINEQLCLEALRKYRKRLCRVIIMTQNLADLDLLYEHDVTRALLANMRFKILLGGLGEPESQRYFADLLGTKKVKKKTITQNSKQRTVSISEEREYIIEPAQLDRMGKKNLILLHSEGKGWMKLRKNPYYKKKKKK